MSEWIESGKRWHGDYSVGESDFLESLGRKEVAGLVIQVQEQAEGQPPGEVQTYLIGHANEVGGCCGCCLKIGYNDVVLRYKMLNLEELFK